MMDVEETTGPILEVRGLKLSIRTDEGIARILDHIDFALQPGHILGIVGESGCGKSTVIRAILGILRAATVEAGEIRFRREFAGLPGATSTAGFAAAASVSCRRIPPGVEPGLQDRLALLEIMRWHAPRSKAAASRPPRGIIAPGASA